MAIVAKDATGLLGPVGIHSTRNPAKDATGLLGPVGIHSTRNPAKDATELLGPVEIHSTRNPNQRYVEHSQGYRAGQVNKISGAITCIPTDLLVHV